jgi:cation-transporting ATPase 13A3/4/5
MATALFLSTYLLLDPAKWLVSLMDLTEMSWDFKVILLVIAIIAFALMYCCEIWLFPRLAKWIGEVTARARPGSKKKRKEYKVIIEGMRAG